MTDTNTLPTPVQPTGETILNLRPHFRVLKPGFTYLIPGEIPVGEVLVVERCGPHLTPFIADGKIERIDLEVKGCIPGVCQLCGCTWTHACEGGCAWVNAEHSLCSSCWLEMPVTFSGKGLQGLTFQIQDGVSYSPLCVERHSTKALGPQARPRPVQQYHQLTDAQLKRIKRGIDRFSLRSLGPSNS